MEEIAQRRRIMQAERKALMLRKDDGKKSAAVYYAISTETWLESNWIMGKWFFLEADVEGSRGSCVQGIF